MIHSHQLIWLTNIFLEYQYIKRYSHGVTQIYHTPHKLCNIRGITNFQQPRLPPNNEGRPLCQFKCPLTLLKWRAGSRPVWFFLFSREVGSQREGCTVRFWEGEIFDWLIPRWVALTLISWGTTLISLVQHWSSEENWMKMWVESTLFHLFLLYLFILSDKT